MAELGTKGLLRALNSTTSSQEPVNPRFGWRGLSERLSLVFLILLFAVTGFIPAWNRLNSDFPNYYLAARLYRQGYPLERVYEWQWFQRQSDHAAIDQRLVGYIPMTLPSALAVLPFSSLPALQAKRCWLLLNLAFVLLTAILMSRSTNLGPWRVGLLIFLAFIPLRSNFLLGQMHVLVLLLLTMAACLYFRKQFFLSGITLAVAAALKIYPALFLIFFLIKRQWRAAGGLGIGIGASILLSIYLFGVDACRVYAQQVLPWAMRAQITDPYDVTWGSLNALLSRLFIAEPEWNPSPVAHLPWLYSLLYSLIAVGTFVAFMWVLSFRSETGERQKVEWATYLFLLLMLSSQPASYHFVVLILPVVLVTDHLVENGRERVAVGLVGIYVLALGSFRRLCKTDPAGWRTLACFPRLCFLFLLAGLLLWILIWPSDGYARPRLKSRAGILAAAAFVTLFTFSFAASLRHFKGQFDNYRFRIITVHGSTLAADPIALSDDLFFTALVPHFLDSNPDTYAVHELKDNSLSSFAAGGDWFHPAVEEKRNTGWAELATRSGSRIVRFSPPMTARTADMVVEVEDAEQPIVSLDGKLLAFMREVKGRNSLWVRPVGDTASGERQIAGPQFDVREAAFFPDHRIIFSARREGRFRLYRVDDPSEQIIEEMGEPDCSARYPAISPDGDWMAFSCQHGSAWQIHTMNLRSRKQVQLTHSDCNSVSPAWTPDSKSLIYATDCGRGLGLTALARLSVAH
jgi:hypothetical protein